MIAKLDCPEVPLHRASLTQFEKNRREPQLIILLKYARLAGTSVDFLIDDGTIIPKFSIYELSHKNLNA